MWFEEIFFTWSASHTRNEWFGSLRFSKFWRLLSSPCLSNLFESHFNNISKSQGTFFIFVMHHFDVYLVFCGNIYKKLYFSSLWLYFVKDWSFCSLCAVLNGSTFEIFFKQQWNENQKWRSIWEVMMMRLNAQLRWETKFTPAVINSFDWYLVMINLAQ